MPATVYQTINVDSRNHLIRNRDALKTEFGIDIFFPRNKVRGQFQEMSLNGGTKAIFEAQKKIAIILADWQQEFDAFKDRKKRRQQHQQHDSDDSSVNWPSIPIQEVNMTTKSTNPFEGLTLDEEESVADIIPVVKPKKPSLTCWSKVVSGEVTTSSTAKPKSTDQSSCWGDMFDEEE